MEACSVVKQRAMVSHERGGAPVMIATAVRRNAALPRVGRWCWWLEEVEVMA